jgi:hypothetical protein
VTALLRSDDGSVEWSISEGQFDEEKLLRAVLKVVVNGEAWPELPVALNPSGRFLMLVVFEEVPQDVELREMSDGPRYPIKDGWDATDGAFVFDLCVEPGSSEAEISFVQRSGDGPELRAAATFSVGQFEPFYAALRQALCWPEHGV